MTTNRTFAAKLRKFERSPGPKRYRRIEEFVFAYAGLLDMGDPTTGDFRSQVSNLFLADADWTSASIILLV